MSIKKRLCNLLKLFGLLAMLAACATQELPPLATRVELPTRQSQQTLPANPLPTPTMTLPTQVGTNTPPPEPELSLTEAEIALNMSRVFLAKRLGIDKSAIKLVSQQEVQWRDGCLELPGKDEMCTLAIVLGYRIILETSGLLYELRTDRSGMAIRMQPIAMMK